VLKLSENKNNHITVIDNLWRGDDKYIKHLSNVNIIIGDLTDSQLCLNNIKDVDVVFHLAEIVSGVDFAFNNQLFIYRQNVLINSNVLNACIKNNVKNYIYVGTACSYPKENQHIQGLNYFKEEDIHPLTPETSYGMSKYLGEYECQLAAKESNINVGILRLHNVYGPYCSLDDKTSQVIPALIKKTLTSETKLEIWGSGNQYRDFIYVDDVVNGLLLMLEKGMNKGVIQIGTGQAITINNIAENLVSISDKNLQIYHNLNKPQGDFGRLAIIDKAKEILGWTPKISFKEGLSNTYLFIKNNI
jgi:nucleoside-diphosphate-sugar epimerase